MILVHVMILITLLAWLASMFLSAVLSRQIVAKQTMKSSEIRETMNAASARIPSCLAGNPPAVPSFPETKLCSTAIGSVLSLHMQTCLGGASPTTFTVGPVGSARPVNFRICNTPDNPPCRIRINVCEVGDICAAPPAACP